MFARALKGLTKACNQFNSFYLNGLRRNTFTREFLP